MSAEPEVDSSARDPLFSELKKLWTHRSLLSTLTINDLRYRYMGSSIGFFWTVITPLLELATYTFVFHLIIGVQFVGNLVLVHSLRWRHHHVHGQVRVRR